MSSPITARETFTGRYVDLADPLPEDICLEDIAHHLSLLCRFGGSVRRFYSVAEHAVLVSHRVRMQGGSVDQQLVALHHDDGEAYLVDIPSPMKRALENTNGAGGLGRLNAKMDKAIFTALELPWPTFEPGTSDEHGPPSDPLNDPVIHDADRWALAVEANSLMPSRGKRWSQQYPGRVVTPSWWFGGLLPMHAKELFLKRHKELTA